MDAFLGFPMGCGYLYIQVPGYRLGANVASMLLDETLRMCAAIVTDGRSVSTVMLRIADGWPQ